MWLSGLMMPISRSFFAHYCAYFYLTAYRRYFDSRNNGCSFASQSNHIPRVRTIFGSSGSESTFPGRTEQYWESWSDSRFILAQSYRKLSRVHKYL
ncbi:uncharacterized protein EI90DRAFT_1743461 [Cantharellus anzutake]|uniref:uncharacterized protein n=1 Tax=Cantharellus anzutake TaxID=1750568 RepID=UPI0019040A5C|nr:uncharacterized protein EI90DRAFT_1743461 [Cantharellus anzutake]KAF8341480.1 hypothetical protein EI90DRAFT_1743461 [Cantharellus anzutake]